jgi:hypothetical protein
MASTGIRALDLPARTGCNEDTTNKFSSSGPRLLAGARYFLFRNLVGPAETPVDFLEGEDLFPGVKRQGSEADDLNDFHWCWG